MRASLHETTDAGGIPVADRPIARWLIALAIVVIGWSIYYLIAFGESYTGTFPRPERPAGATTTHE